MNKNNPQVKKESIQTNNGYKKVFIGDIIIRVFKFIFSILIFLGVYIFLSVAFQEEFDFFFFVIGLLLFLWGTSWFLQIFLLNNTIIIKKIIGKINSVVEKIYNKFKKLAHNKYFKIIVVISIIIYLMIWAINFIAGLSATTIIIILLILILLK